jgi:hypothetical protein
MFPLLFPHGESGYTNAIKDCLSPAEYVMTKMLIPKEIKGKYMTALSGACKLHIIDSRNGIPFASDEDVHHVELHSTSIFMSRHLRVN